MTRLEKKLAALEIVSPAQLREAWAEAYDTPAPRLPVDLLRLGVAYRLQEKAGKGLTAATMRLLRQRLDKKAAPSPVSAALRPGTQLIRTWQGRTIRVTIEPDGYDMDGKHYASLSAIAREVTGAHWSGPRFFGLKVKAA